MSLRFSHGGRRGRDARHNNLIPRPYTNTHTTANTEPDLFPDADADADAGATEGLLPQPLRLFSLPSEPAPGEGTSDLMKPENFKFLGSYNWMDSPRPTILVPGSPPVWHGRPLPFHVPFDEGLQVFDPNGYHMRSSTSSPLLPLFRAVDAIAEDNADTTMDWPSIDFIADRSSLRKLLRWVRHTDAKRFTGEEGAPAPGKVQDFRIDLQLGGAKTVLMQRWDTRTCQYVSGPHFGCRVNFEKVTTVPARGCATSSSHNRIVQYDLDGLRMVVRFEVDAKITTDATEGATAADDLSNLMAGLSMVCQTLAPRASSESPIPTPTITDSDTVVTVVRGGIQVPQSSIVEITTRSAKGASQHSWRETYTQLFLSQTPQHVLAVHQRGTFEQISTRPLNSLQFARVAADGRVQRNFRQLVGVLREVQGLVREHGRRGRLSLVCRGGRLELFERGDGADVSSGCLPDGELARFGI